MMGFKRKVLRIGVIACIISSLLFSAAYAADGFKTIQAWFGDIRVISNNQVVTSDVQPFIVDGTTYIPVRMMANVFNKEVLWDGTTRTITINDKPDSTVAALKQELEGKNFQISQLENKIQMLEQEAEYSTGRDIDIYDLEDDLNDDYGRYKNIDFKISLSGDKKKVSVKITVNLKTYSSKWKSLTTNNKTSYLQDICDDIADVYPDAKIEGYIRDSSTSDKLVTFSTSSSGKVKMSESGSDLSDLEEDLNDDYNDYFSGIKLYIELEEDDDDIIFTVEIDGKKYRDKWDDLSNSKIQTFMSRIYDEIEDEFDDGSITGYVYDTYDKEDLAKYTRSSSGSARFTRY